MMAKSCCYCFTSKTGTVILGCFGIVFFVLALVPHCLILENHDYHVTQFIKEQRLEGTRDIPDETIPALKEFSKSLWSQFIAYDVAFTFASILLIAGVSASKRYLLVPWMFMMFLTILLATVVLLAIVIDAVKNHPKNVAFIVFTAAFPVAMAAYFWFAVYFTFVQLRAEEAERGSNGGHLYRSDSCPARIGLTAVVESDPNSAGTPSVSCQHGSAGIGLPGVLMVHDEATELALPTADAAKPDDHDDHDDHDLCSKHPRSSSESGSRPGCSGKGTQNGSPPPPYEAVAIDIDKEEKAIAAGVNRADLTFALTTTSSASTHGLRANRMMGPSSPSSTQASLELTPTQSRLYSPISSSSSSSGGVGQEVVGLGLGGSIVVGGELEFCLPRTAEEETNPLLLAASTSSGSTLASTSTSSPSLNRNPSLVTPSTSSSIDEDVEEAEAMVKKNQED